MADTLAWLRSQVEVVLGLLGSNDNRLARAKEIRKPLLTTIIPDNIMRFVIASGSFRHYMQMSLCCSKSK